MADRRIDIEARWLGESVSRGTKQTTIDLQRVGSAAKSLLPALAGTAGLYGALQEVKAGFRSIGEEQQENIRLFHTLKRQAGDATSQMALLGGQLQQLRQATPFGDTEITQTLRILTDQTGDYSGALDNLGLVLDIAADGQKSLDESARIVAFTMKGEIERAGELSAEIKNLAREHRDLMGTADGAKLALDKLHEVYGGRATQELEGYVGAWDHLKNSWAELRDQALLMSSPLDDQKQGVSAVSKEFDRLAKLFEDNRETGAYWIRTMFTLGLAYRQAAMDAAIFNDVQRQSAGAFGRQELLGGTIFTKPTPPGPEPPTKEELEAQAKAARDAADAALAHAKALAGMKADAREQLDLWEKTQQRIVGSGEQIVSMRDEMTALVALSTQAWDTEGPTLAVPAMEQLVENMKQYRKQLSETVQLVPDMGADINHRMQTLNSLIGQQLQGTISGALMTGATQGGQAMVAYLKDLFLRELFTNLAAGILNALSGGTMGTFSILGQAVGLNNPGTSAGRGPFSNSIQQQQLWRLQRG